ncbi:MAG: hypothetical protein JNM93_02760 [Bacteriovoracaceae bacterium]|nr:hypothetical protein [Bacteriovoracaceae bacterium]
MPRLYTFLFSFFIFIAALIMLMGDASNPTHRLPASVVTKGVQSSEDFMASVISTRQLQKILKTIIDSSNSLFFTNTQEYLCFELGKMDSIQDELSATYQRNKEIWPESQTETISHLMLKGEKSWKSLCENTERREIKLKLMKFGNEAKLAIDSVYQDTDFSLNYREYFEQLEQSIDKAHHEKILKDIEILRKKILKISYAESLKTVDLCYKIGFDFFDYYILNTSYLDSSEKTAERFISKQRKIGRMIKELGPLCQRKNNLNILKKIESIKSEL